jgi:hypothetical protein
MRGNLHTHTHTHTHAHTHARTHAHTHKHTTLKYVNIHPVTAKLSIQSACAAIFVLLHTLLYARAHTLARTHAHISFYCIFNISIRISYIYIYILHAL